MLKPHLGLDLREVLYPQPADEAVAELQLRQTKLAQPALFVIEYALAQMLISYGVKPEAMIGHSLGEYVAACLGGVFSLKAGLGLVVQRARMMQALEGGAMTAVPKLATCPLFHAHETTAFLRTQATKLICTYRSLPKCR